MPALTFAEFSNLFEDFRRCALRLEARPRTDVPEEVSDLTAFVEDRLPRMRHRDPGAWSTMIERQTAAGRMVRRVRVLPEPLTDYSRYMVYCARASVGNGEDIRFLTRARAAALDLPDHDFWVLDSTRLIQLRFTTDDRPLDHDLIVDPAVVARHEAWIRRALDAATRWADYLAEDPTREWPAIRAEARTG